MLFLVARSRARAVSAVASVVAVAASAAAAVASAVAQRAGSNRRLSLHAVEEQLVGVSGGEGEIQH